jgi:predicted MPP superfamily phosphohydrolase
MKILIIHLSDIHLSDSTKRLNDRASKIVDAVKNIETEIGQVIFAITGDVAFSGKESEYEIAANFLDELRNQAKIKICSDIKFVIVPGNHDCQFTEGNEDARNELIETIRSKEFKISGKSIIDICLKNQQNFFANCFDFYCDIPLSNFDKLFYQFVIEKNEFKVSFNCINSAWISVLKENDQYGKMGFPSEYLKGNQDSNITISLFHHPYNWFSQNNYKEVKKYLVENSDIILTGHEHEPNQAGYLNYKGKKNIDFIEGGVLNNSSSENESSFNAIFIDTNNNNHKIYQLDYTGELYTNEAITEDWISNNHHKTPPSKFGLNEYQKKWLSDPGATIYYQYDDESLTLDEIFVFPELKDTFSDEENIKLDDKTSSEELLKVDEKQNRYFIVGSEFIGKTILLKKLFVEFFNAGFIPVYIEGKQVKETSPDSFRKLLLECINNQYDNEDVEALEQLDKSKLYILIDNFHQCGLPLKYKARFLESNFIEKEGKQIYPNIIICGNDFMQFEELIYKDDQFVNPLIYFKSYRLLPLGVSMRYKLIEKWYRNKRRNLDETELIQKIEQAERLIDTNLGNNFIPKFPLFILVHLHQIDLERQTELKTSSYGYYYEYLIVTAISRKDTELLDSYMTYLTHFANFLFTEKSHEITEDEFERFDREVFRSKRRIAKDFKSILKFLKSIGIIEEKNHLYRIKHNFIYYYFLARYLRDTLSTEETKDIIRALVLKLYKDENSNILIFLTHLSKDNFILETIINCSRTIFQDVKPLEINSDCNAIDSLIETLPKLIVENEDIKKNREEHRKQLGKSESLPELPDYNTSNEENEDDENLGKVLLNNLRLSIKALQILGQIGKNYHGSLTITQLHDVIEEAYLLGLRTVNSFITFLENNTDAVVSLISDRLSEILKEKNIDIEEDRKTEMAKRLTFSLCLMVIGNFIKRISFAVGTDKLHETFNEILEKYDWNSVKLIDISIKLDHYHYLPIKDIIDANKSLKKKKISSILLKIFVKFYLEMYPESIENLQKLSSELDIDMKTLRLLVHKQKTND